MSCLNIPNESKKVGAEFLKKWVLKDIPSLGPEWQERYKVKIDEKAILEFYRLFQQSFRVSSFRNQLKKQFLV